MIFGQITFQIDLMLQMQLKTLIEKTASVKPSRKVKMPDTDHKITPINVQDKKKLKKLCKRCRKKKRKTKEPVANFSDISIQAQFDEAFQNLQGSFIEDLIEFQ